MRTYYKEKLKMLEDLEPNWDGDGSIIIDRPLLQHATHILEFVELEYDEEFPLAFLSPISGGGLQIEWENDKKYLEFEFNDDYELWVMGLLNPRTEEKEILWYDACKYDDYETIKKLLDWYKENNK